MAPIKNNDANWCYETQDTKNVLPNSSPLRYLRIRSRDVWSTSSTDFFSNTPANLDSCRTVTCWHICLTCNRQHTIYTDSSTILIPVTITFLQTHILRLAWLCQCTWHHDKISCPITLTHGTSFSLKMTMKETCTSHMYPHPQGYAHSHTHQLPQSQLICIHKVTQYIPSPPSQRLAQAQWHPHANSSHIHRAAQHTHKLRTLLPPTSGANNGDPFSVVSFDDSTNCSSNWNRKT